MLLQYLLKLIFIVLYAIFINIYVMRVVNYVNQRKTGDRKMTENELVKLMDEYMGNSGFYMKPRVDDEKTSFFIAKGTAMASDVQKSFDAVGVRTDASNPSDTDYAKVLAPQIS